VSNFGRFFIDGLKELAKSVRYSRLAAALALLQIKNQYRRSVMGTAWIVINNAALICGLGFIFANVQGIPLSDFFPSLTIGLLTWFYLSSCLTCGAANFKALKFLVAEPHLGKFITVIYGLISEFLVFAHSLILIPIIIFVSAADFYVNLNLIIGFIILAFNLFALSTILSIISLRYQDFESIIKSFLQLAFYATPIVWDARFIEGSTLALFLKFNLFNYYVDLIRSPILHGVFHQKTILVTITSGLVLLTLAILMLGASSKKISTWI
jgi:ABC-type polysaccharide/polyol phosphate export permease